MRTLFKTTLTLPIILSTALFVGALSLGGCAKKQKSDDISVGTDMGDTSQLGDSDSGKALGLETIRFPYDSFTLTDESRTTLKNNASIMKDKSSLKIQIEGHCDSRGGIQYNIALGEKRANAVKKFMEEQGVDGGRISTISYGKERLLDPSEAETAHSKNRRANFVVTSR